MSDEAATVTPVHTMRDSRGWCLDCGGPGPDPRHDDRAPLISEQVSR